MFTIIDRLTRFCLENKLVTFLLTLTLTIGGVMYAPFDWSFARAFRDPVPVDAIPDIGENQQIVFAEWAGRSPRDMEDQVTYPLTTALTGVPNVKTVRSVSMQGFSMIFVIFDEDVEYYWSRSRLLEKLNSLPSGALPADVKPMLGPDATALGQVFWYTLEGRDPEGNPAGGWDLDELRSVQDFTVRYALQSAQGVSEVASIGGYVREVQVDVDPEAMRAAGITLPQVVDAVRDSNLDVGAGVLDLSGVEYLVRGVGFLRTLEDLEQSVVTVRDHVPVLLHQVASVSHGPAFRRGALDKEGTETVGGVVVVRYGENPLNAIRSVKEKIAEMASSLPRKTLEDGTVSQMTIVPFYDRTELIYETLGTLSRALFAQILITSIVVLIMVRHLASALLIALTMPLAVLACFIAMRKLGVDANLVSLAGIAIAIGTIVDMGIIVCENIQRHFEEDYNEGDAEPNHGERLEIIYRAVSEVGGAVFTAIATTVISFLAVFSMEAAEGKLFRPLAFTKTFVLIGSLGVALFLLPALAHLLFRSRPRMPIRVSQGVMYGLAALCLLWLTLDWMPLGPDRGWMRNGLLVLALTGSVLGALMTYQYFYPRILRVCLNHKRVFLIGPVLLMLMGLIIWIGIPKLTGWLPSALRINRAYSTVAHAFPGLGKEFMPPLDEGSYLYMPTAMPHAALGEVLDMMQIQDQSFYAIPEVEQVVGKLGRAESALDPAPVPMLETVIEYHPEYLTDRDGRRLAFAHTFDEDDWFRSADGEPLWAPDGKPYRVRGMFKRDAEGQLVPDRKGRPFRQWRPALDPELNEGREAWAGIRRPDDIWDEIVRAGEVTGMTSAPRLQPISTRIVMLQSGMRAPMGLKVRGPNLVAIEAATLMLEQELKHAPGVNPPTVNADRVVGKPYLEVHPDRAALARYGVSMVAFQEWLETAIGGREVTRTVEGRERYPVRVRYARETRDSIEALEGAWVPVSDGGEVPLRELASIEYVRGPEMIRSEDSFLIGYVLFDKQPDWAEVDVVEEATAYLGARIASGDLVLPEGVSYVFSGSYENQVRATRKLAMVVPLSLMIIFLILYMQFKRVPITLMVFTGIFLAWSGGFLLIWLYGTEGFLNIVVLGVNLRELFSVHPINMSVAVWVGFLALFGIATDDGVVMCTYLKQRFDADTPNDIAGVREAVIEAGLRRIRPCMMTTATTLLALIPVLSSSGRGADLMIPMAIPSFGGMLIQVLTTLLAPVLFCAWQEKNQKKSCTLANRG